MMAMVERIRDVDGKFLPLGDREIMMSRADLPNTNRGVIRLYQKYGILPKDLNGIPLTLKNMKMVNMVD